MGKMRWMGLLAIVILCAGAMQSSAQQILLGFIGDQGTFGDHNNAAFEWANETFGDGIIFGMGWRLPHWTEDNSDRPTLEKLTINLIDYLASESAFLAVDCTRSAFTTWATLKVR
jgi:hypothetical protein